VLKKFLCPGSGLLAAIPGTASIEMKNSKIVFPDCISDGFPNRVIMYNNKDYSMSDQRI